MNRIKILIADDHAVLRSGLKMMLNAQKDMEVVGEASDGSEIINLCQKLKPDVLLLDINMPEKSGLKTIPEIKATCPWVKILVLTMHDDESYLKDVLKMGGDGYILKKAADTALISAIRAVNRGEIYIEPSMTKSLIGQMFNTDEKTEENENTETQALSLREKEVLQLVAQGYTNKQIADQLYVSVKTVETHKSRLKKKLNLERRSDLVRYAIKEGLVEFD